jgi:hypothetical protein
MCVQGVCWGRLLMHNAGEVCVTWRCHVRVCVCVCVDMRQKKLFGAVWLRPLTNLEVPFGAGACTLKLCRFIWCGEYRSAVKVSTCNTNPHKGWYPMAGGVALLNG